MRPIALGFVALLLPACLVGGGGITGIGDDQTVGDDGTGGGGGGDGSGSGSGSGNTTTPRITATVDKGTVNTELGKTETLQVMISGANGFSGAVSVTPSVMNGTTPVTGWTMTATPASVTLDTDGTAMVSLAVKVPTDAAVLAPTIKIDLGGTAT